MLNVFITVDTELWPRTPDWRASSLSQEMEYYIFGRTRDGEFGLPYQMDVLNAHGLKAVFFVEPLFACAVGLGPLRQIVGMIRDRGHDVQLHMHTEWLYKTDSILPGRTGQNIKDFTEDEQTLLLARGMQNLAACGVAHVRAFRAGNYGANFDTLRALSRNGILYDSSYNFPYLKKDCGMPLPEPLLQPRQLHGVYEFPISFFRDWPGHYRHAQLCACSRQELENALLGAWRSGWYSFVLVSHSFELIRFPTRAGNPAFADRIAVKRFEWLCRFLAGNRDKFRTAVFSEVAPEAIPATAPSPPLRSSIYRTARRVVEQLRERMHYSSLG